MPQFLKGINFNYEIPEWASILGFALTGIAFAYAIYQRKKYRNLNNLVRGAIAATEAVCACRELARLVDYRKFGDARDRMRETRNKIRRLSENSNTKELISKDDWVVIATYMSDIGNQINGFQNNLTTSSDTKACRDLIDKVGEMLSGVSSKTESRIGQYK